MAIFFFNFLPITSSNLLAGIPIFAGFFDSKSFKVILAPLLILVFKAKDLPKISFTDFNFLSLLLAFFDFNDFLISFMPATNFVAWLIVNDDFESGPKIFLSKHTWNSIISAPSAVAASGA